MQSSTTAAAVHKLCACAGYIWMRTSVAVQCISLGQAVGRFVDVSAHTDLEYFLDAADEDEYFASPKEF